MKLTIAEAAKIPVDPALVARATASNEVRISTARASSSSSGVSVISTAERKKRFEMARLRRELVESRIEEEQAKIDLDAGSKAGSIARLDDVRSEGGDSGPAQRTTDMAVPLLQGRSPHPTSPATLAESSNRHYTSEQTTIVPITSTVASPLQGGLPLLEAMPLQGGLPESASPLKGGLPPTNTFTINQTVVNNDGCNFGTVSTTNHHDTQVVVENVVRLAESHHHHLVTNMAENATQEHNQLMANLRADLTYEAQQALYLQSEQHSREREQLQRESDVRAADVGRHYAASSADQQNALNYRVQQLELTLRSQEQHHAQVLAPKGQERVAILARACAPNPSSQHTTPELPLQHI